MNFQNFKWLKNSEDGSNFDDFLTDSIATTRTFFQNIRVVQIFASTKKKSSNRSGPRSVRGISETDDPTGPDLTGIRYRSDGPNGHGDVLCVLCSWLLHQRAPHQDEIETSSRRIQNEFETCQPFLVSILATAAVAAGPTAVAAEPIAEAPRCDGGGCKFPVTKQMARRHIDFCKAVYRHLN